MEKIDFFNNTNITAMEALTEVSEKLKELAKPDSEIFNTCTFVQAVNTCNIIKEIQAYAAQLEKKFYVTIQKQCEALEALGMKVSVVMPNATPNDTSKASTSDKTETKTYAGIVAATSTSTVTSPVITKSATEAPKSPPVSELMIAGYQLKLQGPLQGKIPSQFINGEPYALVKTGNYLLKVRTTGILKPTNTVKQTEYYGSREKVPDARKGDFANPEDNVAIFVTMCGEGSVFRICSIDFLIDFIGEEKAKNGGKLPEKALKKLNSLVCTIENGLAQYNLFLTILKTLVPKDASANDWERFIANFIPTSDGCGDEYKKYFGTSPPGKPSNYDAKADDEGWSEDSDEEKIEDVDQKAFRNGEIPWAKISKKAIV